MPTPRVLVVEDELMVATMLEETLADEGCTVVGLVGRLAGAIRLARTAAIDAALLDVNLHGKAVWPVAQILRQRGIPYAFLTGYDCAAIPAGQQPCVVVTKPFRPSFMLDTMRRLLAGAGAPKGVPAQLGDATL